MITFLLLTACSDRMIAYPVEKNQNDDVNDGNILEAVDSTHQQNDTAIYTEVEEPENEQPDEDDFIDTGYSDDTGVDEVIEDTFEENDDNSLEDTDYEDTGSYEEEIIEDEPEEIIEEEPVVVIVDNFNYSDDIAASSSPHWERLWYASDWGWDIVDAQEDLGCGLVNGYIDCDCWTNNNCANDISQHIPFQQFVDLAVAGYWVCAIDNVGSIFCFSEGGETYSPPAAANPYVDVVISGDNVCGLDESGYIYCFDINAGGLTYNDVNTYKVIEGHGTVFCAVHSDGLEITCIDTSNMTVTYNHQFAYEIIGFDSYHTSYCYTYLDGNGMQATNCGWVDSPNQNSFQYCLDNSPHQYYYDFFSNNTDLTNIEVGQDWAAVWDSQTQTEITWGGYLDINGGYYDNSTIVNNGYYTHGGCNYYWGN